ncbi:MAG: hypothetical protein KGL43_21380, partial [Burkholderiales bacterium]|nr:hypothetical protein [Burkholderiales bacterium]
MDTISILLSAFVISFVALLVFIASQRRGLFERSAAGAEVIFAPGEVGRGEEPAAAPAAQASLQSTLDRADGQAAGRGDAQ